MQGPQFEDSRELSECVHVSGVAVPLPPDAFEQSVLDELEKIRNPRNSWTQTIALLVISLLLFATLGMRESPLEFTLLLIGALLFHELGHYVGMRIFGYTNVRMFFIPFLGAAVSGQSRHVKGYQEAIVTILGPLPGLLLAALLLAIARTANLSDETRLNLVRAALLFGFLNAFNLLPIFPLDGGRLLNQLLFSRNRYLEGVFLVFATVALILYSATHETKTFMYLAIWIAITVGPTFKTSTIALNMRRSFDDPFPPTDAPVPLDILRAMIGEVRTRMPGIKAPKATANVIFRVWEKLHLQAPGPLATALLLALYVFAALLTVPWLLPIVLQLKPD